MRVFLSEFLTSGACPGHGSAKAALAVEGAAMLRALATDAVNVAGWRPVVTWDAELEPFSVPGVEVHHAANPEQERELFESLAAQADRTLVIAPEFEQILEQRCRLVMTCGGHSAGSTAEAIALCSDKLALAEHLHRRGVPTIATSICDFGRLIESRAQRLSEGIVVKPRHGAGAVDTFRIRSDAEVAQLPHWIESAELGGEMIVQPFVPGVALSVAGIASGDGFQVFPVCRQRVTGSPRLHYAGGSLPIETSAKSAIEAVVRRAIEAVSGLAGYVGVDVILAAPESGSDSRTPIVVEINPRLTSSYHGYRRLAKGNLARRILTPNEVPAPLEWHSDRVEFQSDGTAVVETGLPADAAEGATKPFRSTGL